MDLKYRKFPKSVLHVNCYVCDVTFHSQDFIQLHLCEFLERKNFEPIVFMLIAMFVVHFLFLKERIKASFD